MGDPVDVEDISNRDIRAAKLRNKGWSVDEIRSEMDYSSNRMASQAIWRGRNMERYKRVRSIGQKRRRIEAMGLTPEEYVAKLQERKALVVSILEDFALGYPIREIARRHDVTLGVVAGITHRRDK